jgi:hypothetical protein
LTDKPEDLIAESLAAELDRTKLTDAVRSESRRVQLDAVRDYLAHELEGNRCKSCRVSQLRTGDQAALVLRLTTVLDAIAALPPEQTGEQEGVTSLASIRDRRSNSRPPGPEDSASTPLGAKQSPRRQGGRRKSR